MALDLALGRLIFGKFDPEQCGSIVYIPLEESTGAIKNQFAEMLNNRGVKDQYSLRKFNIATPEANLNGLTDLSDYIRFHHQYLENPKLYVCDPLGKIMIMEKWDE